jgi:S-formylglutathione hydrolase FrmB
MIPKIVKLIPLYLLLTSCALFEPDTGISESYTFESAAIGAMGVAAVYYPENYTSSTPVIYLLNGWGTDAFAWETGIDLAMEAHKRNIMFVSLSAQYNLYMNNSSLPNRNYEDYVLEIVDGVEQKYGIEIEHSGRAICGISNGGGGAVYLMSQHPNLFSACGSLSGTYYNQINFTNLRSHGIRIDVGKDDDVVLRELQHLHNKLTDERINHDYYEHAGAHDWDFWKKYCPDQFDFLENRISGE